MLLLSAGCQEDQEETNALAGFEQLLDEEMDSQNIPALSVLIFRGAEILYENHLGYTQLEPAIKLDSHHVFLVASVSKVVTATALLQLYDEGLLDLDESINNYLPYKVKVPGYDKDITFRMLLTHTSGIADNDPVLDGQYYYDQDPPLSLSYFLENYLTPGGVYYDSESNFFDFEPGTQYEYSNMGSALIGALVEYISGTDFNTYCRNHIFTPLKMNHTYWRLSEITEPIVRPYDDKNGINHEIPHYTNTDYPNGELRTTTRDMHKWITALTHQGETAGAPLLNKETVMEMMSLQIPDINDTAGLHFFQMDKTHQLWGHDGGEQGVATIMAFNPENLTGAIIFANQGEADLDDLLTDAYLFGLKL
jgi:CubicO group peptidase (beta-lactamase class C family)